MNNLDKKKIVRKKKKLLHIVNELINLDETSIKCFGNTNDRYFSIIRKSLERALALDSKIPSWIKNLDGLSGKKYRYLINNLIEIFPNPKYLEIGSWLGSTACSAIFLNSLNITCIDNWSENYKNIKNQSEVFRNNIQKCSNPNVNFEIIEKDFRIINFSEVGKFNIFFFDGPHHMIDHYDAIKLIQPCLLKKYILIIDDWNWRQVRQGTLDAIKDLKLKIISQLEIKTSQDDLRPIFDSRYSEWHNGYSFFVISK